MNEWMSDGCIFISKYLLRTCFSAVQSDVRRPVKKYCISEDFLPSKTELLRQHYLLYTVRNNESFPWKLLANWIGFLEFPRHICLQNSWLMCVEGSNLLTIMDS
jgi:hypothetical protein